MSSPFPVECSQSSLSYVDVAAHPLFCPVCQPHPHAGVLVDRADDLEAVSQWQSLLHHLHHQEALPAEATDPSASRSPAAPFSCYGVHAQRGRRRYMEDTYAVYLNHELHFSSAEERHLRSRDTEEQGAELQSRWVLFGVFDGHGGKETAEYAAAYMLPSLHSALMHHGHTGAPLPMPHPNDTPPAAPLPVPSPVLPAHSSIPAAAAHSSNVSSCFEDTFQRLDEEFLELVARPQQMHDGSTALVAGIQYKGEAERSKDDAAFQLVVANLGDCRAIYVQPLPSVLAAASHGAAPSSPAASAALDADAALPRGAVASLSVDHKPDLDEERQWVESQGGFVSNWDGLARVQGVLAVSRALGDLPLKPMVRSKPDVRVMQLDDIIEDEATMHPPLCDALPADSFPSCDASLSESSSPLLLLASDGFWDVFTNDEAAAAVVDYLRAHTLLTASTSPSASAGFPSAPSADAPSGPPMSPSAPLLSSLAQSLVSQAYLRGSMDNITLMAIDLRCMQRWIKRQVEERERARTQRQHGSAATDATQPNVAATAAEALMN